MNAQTSGRGISYGHRYPWFCYPGHARQGRANYHCYSTLFESLCVVDSASQLSKSLSTTCVLCRFPFYAWYPASGNQPHHVPEIKRSLLTFVASYSRVLQGFQHAVNDYSTTLQNISQHGAGAEILADRRSFKVETEEMKKLLAEMDS